MNRRSLSRRKSGISEVVGALLLIMIVVVAVGAFAYFLSTIQAQNQSRVTFLNDVADEKLQISNLQLSPSNPTIQYEIYDLSNGSRFYMQMLNDGSVDLINETTGAVYPTSLEGGLYNSINFSARASLDSLEAPTTIKFSALGTFGFRTASWSNANITVRNLNIQSSGIRAIQVDGSYLNNSWYIVNSNGQIQPFLEYNFTSTPITLPARASLNIMLNLTYLSLPRNESLQIVLLTSEGNYFSTFYGPPSAVIGESVTSENYLITSRDVPTFSGSASTGANGSFIKEYIWQIDVPKSNVQSDWTWSSVGSIDTVFAYGQSFQYRPEAFFTPPQLSASTSTVLVDFTADFTLAQVGQYLVYTSGPAAGEFRLITGYTTNTLTTGQFSPAPDASGDSYEILTLTPTTVTGTTTNATSTVLVDSTANFNSTLVGDYLTYTTGPAVGKIQVISSVQPPTNLSTAAFSPAPTADGGDHYTVFDSTLVTSGTTNTLDINGPFMVTLTTVDQYGFMTTSQSTVFVNDSSISTVGSITGAPPVGTCSSGDFPQTVTAYDIFGRPLSNVPVQFLGADGVTIAPGYTFAATSSNGQATTCYSGSGLVEVVSGDLTPVFLPVT